MSAPVDQMSCPARLRMCVSYPSSKHGVRVQCHNASRRCPSIVVRRLARRSFFFFFRLRGPRYGAALASWPRGNRPEGPTPRFIAAGRALGLVASRASLHTARKRAGATTTLSEPQCAHGISLLVRTGSPPTVTRVVYSPPPCIGFGEHARPWVIPHLTTR